MDKLSNENDDIDGYQTSRKKIRHKKDHGWAWFVLLGTYLFLHFSIFLFTLSVKAYIV